MKKPDISSVLEEPLLSPDEILKELTICEAMRENPRKRRGATARARLENLMRKVEWLDLQFHQHPRGSFLNEPEIQRRFEEFYEWYHRVTMGEEQDAYLTTLESLEPVGEIADDTWTGVQVAMENCV